MNDRVGQGTNVPVGGVRDQRAYRQSGDWRAAPLFVSKRSHRVDPHRAASWHKVRKQSYSDHRERDGHIHDWIPRIDVK